MKQALRVLAAGLLGAILVHIAVVLAFPAVGGRDLWSALEEFGPPSQFAVLPRSAPGEETIAYLDPAMFHSVCRVDLAAGAYRVTADIGASYWSLGVLDRRGRSLYGLNSGSAGGPALDLLLISSTQLESLRQDPPAILDEVIVVELDAGAVIVVLRSFVGDRPVGYDPPWLDSAACPGPVELREMDEAIPPEPTLPVAPPEAG